MRLSQEIEYAVKRRVGVPTTHPNGFVILPVGETLRLHVWPDVEIAKQTPRIPIHDHSCDFESRVYVGRLVNVTYETRPHSGAPTDVEPHVVYMAHHSPSFLTPTENVVIPRALLRERVLTGSEYAVRVRVMHETIAEGLTLSLYRKTGRYEILPRVLVPMSAGTPADFNPETANSIDLLWDIIDRAVGRAV